MPSATYHPTLVARLNDLTLRAIVATKTPPPMAARILALVHTCIYEAWTQWQTGAKGVYLRDYMAPRVTQDYESEVAEAIAFSAYRALDAYFGAKVRVELNNPMMEQFMHDNGYDHTNVGLDPSTAAGVGNRCAAVVLDHFKGDGANTFKTIEASANYADYTSYRPVIGMDDTPPPNLADRWQPLKKPDGTPQQFLVPHWGLVQPFALPHGASLRPFPPPASWDSDKLKKMAEEILYISANLSSEHKAIAEYWMDGPGSVTPPGHWCLIAQKIATRDRHELDDDVKLFFALGNALMDAGIAAWDCKRAYDTVRPVTLIRNWYKNKDIMGWGGPGSGINAVKMKGKDWKPYQKLDFVTPSFPEFVSGHSTFSAAAASILRRFTGRDYYGGSTVISHLDIDERDLNPLVTLRWNSFSEAARQAGLSRLYGGIHFMEGNLRGLELGEKVANLVWKKATALWDGDY